MTTTIHRMLQVGDTIEIASFDECCNMGLRRVRVTEVLKKLGTFRVIGVNMHGNFPIAYKLPLHPFTELVSKPNTTIWTFTESVPGEE